MSSTSENIAEDYYQISEAVLSSFSKYRLPLDLFTFDESVARVVLYYKKDNRLSNEQVEEINTLCQNDQLYVSRSDHPIYSKHIIKQLDLVLMDKNLKEVEIADIIITGISWRLNELFNQPVKTFFDFFYQDAMVWAEFLFHDKHRIKVFLRRLNTGEHSLALHSINTAIVGLWLLMLDKDMDLTKRELDNSLLAFLLHDIGMSKVPSFITSKAGPLKQEERDKVNSHVLTGSQVLLKNDKICEEIKVACLQHHERKNGTGYPQKIKDTEFKRIGSICAVADSFSAMVQRRVYAEAKTYVAAAAELSQDKMKYDGHYTAMLLTAAINNTFT